MIEHLFTISLEQIKLHPNTQKSELSVDDTDYFVKYLFPNGDDLKLESFTIACKLNNNFENRIEHKIFAKEVKKEFSTSFFKKYKETNFIPFELWKRSYFPNLREQFLAKGEILFEKFLSLTLNDHKKDSFIVPLIINDSDEQKLDKFIGQLFIDVEYKWKHLYDFFTKPRISNQSLVFE